MPTPPKLFVLLFALVAVMSGQLFGVRGKLVCPCGPYLVQVSSLECAAAECHDPSLHQGQAFPGKENQKGNSQPSHHQLDQRALELTNGLPGPVGLPQIFPTEFPPFAFGFGSVTDKPVAAALRLVQPGRWGPGTEMPLVSLPLLVAEFTVLLI